MPTPANYKQVAGLYKTLPPTLQKYIAHYPKLVTADLPFEAAMAYLFQRVERAHRRAIYAGIIKKFSANGTLTDQSIQKAHLTRAEFDGLFERIFKVKVPEATRKYLKDAEKIRDKSMHGVEVDDPPLRKAIQDILKYLEGFDTFVNTTAGFQPCGDLRGLTGASEKLDGETTRWILKGLQLPMS